MNTQSENIHANSGFAKGKRAPSNRKAVCFEDFLTTYPGAPITDLAPALNYPMDLNDRVGDCVIAQFDHSIQVIKYLLTSQNINFTEAQIIAFYKTQNPGFDINGSASTNGPGSIHDNGMDIQTFLEYLVSKGYITAFAKIDWKNDAQLKAAIYLGLAVSGGVQLQEAQMDQFNKNVPWDYVPGSKIDGGHAVPPVGYNGVDWQLITWGKLINFTSAFKDNCFDECWFIITPDHIAHPGFRNHFDLAGFSAAVSQLTGGKVVVPVPTVATRTLELKTPYMTGDDVKAVQVLLGINADGVFGPATKAAVVSFQKSIGITADGIVGPITLADLKKKAQ